MSVNNPPRNAIETNKLSARSNNSGRLRMQLINNTGNAEGLSQVSESYDQSYLSHHFDLRNEVDLELIELMKQSQSVGLMDECAVIERVSGVVDQEGNT